MVRDTRTLTDGALMSAVTAVIGLIGIYITPLYFIMTTMVMPLPLIILVRRRDLRVGVLAILVSGLIMLLFYPDPLQIFGLLLISGPVGLTLGVLFKNYISYGKSIVITTLVAILATLLMLIISYSITGINLTSLQKMMTEALNQAFQFDARMGVKLSPEEQNLIRNQFDAAFLLVPGLWAVWMAISSIVTYSLARRILIRLNYPVPEVYPFNQWRFPWYTIWGPIIGLSFIIAGSRYNWTDLQVTGNNILFLFGFAFFIIGLAVLVNIQEQWKLPRSVKIIQVFFLILFIGYLYIPIIVLGLFDTVINFRRLPKEPVS